MNRTKIEWVTNPDGSQGYTWNPITGCLNHVNGLCKGGGFPCYACRLANGRLKQRYLKGNYRECITPEGSEPSNDPFYPRFWQERLEEVLHRRIDSPLKGIFPCDMSDLFGIGIPEEWTRKVLSAIETNFYDRFYLLTKQPQRLPEFSPFPDNCFVGVTATNQQAYLDAIYTLVHVKAPIRYISFEPLLTEIPMTPEQLMASINWLIIGACTGTVKEMSHLFDKYPHLTPVQWEKKWTAQPRIEWVREIVEAADKAGVKVFLKDNLLELVNYQSPETDFAFNKEGSYRQEMPA